MRNREIEFLDIKEPSMMPHMDGVRSVNMLDFGFGCAPRITDRRGENRMEGAGMRCRMLSVGTSL